MQQDHLGLLVEKTLIEKKWQTPAFKIISSLTIVWMQVGKMDAEACDGPTEARETSHYRWSKTPRLLNRELKFTYKYPSSLQTDHQTHYMLIRINDGMLNFMQPVCANRHSLQHIWALVIARHAWCKSIACIHLWLMTAEVMRHKTLGFVQSNGETEHDVEHDVLTGQ